MKAASLGIVLAVAGLLVPSSSLVAQQQGTGPSLVAVIDIAQVFERHEEFKARMEQIKQEVQSFELELKSKRDSIMERAAQLQEMNAASPDYKQLEATLAKEEADLQIQAAQKRKDVLDREAQVYLETYNQVVEAVTRIAEHNGITLVIRFDRSEIDATNRGEVIKMVNRNVVYNAGYDLTDMVVDLLSPKTADQNRGAGATR